MNKLVLTTLLGVFAAEAMAWGGSCKYEREIEREVAVDSATILMLVAGAGELDVKGRDRDDVRIRAKLCSDNKEVLAKLDVMSELESDQLTVKTIFPDRGDWQATIDLELEVPSRLLVDAKDSSGEASVSNVAGLTMIDSSGELEIEGIAGDVSVTDSSGELSIEEVGGNVQVTDSSGGISASDIEGDFVVEVDSSGEIDVRRVGQNVLIKRDSSGSIEVDTVGGDFTVRADSSGGINHEKVAGAVSLPN